MTHRGLRSLRAIVRVLPPHLRSRAAWLFFAGSALLLAAASRQLADGIDPDSLWLDDLWVATLVKRASLQQLVQLHAPTPYGFIALLKLIRAAFGDGHLQLQAAPVLARLAAIAGVGLVTFELTRNPGLALVAAAGMALQRDLAEQALRIKQYSLDACVSVLLLGCAVALLRRPGLGRLAAFGGLCLLALPCSFPSAFVGPPLFSLCALSIALPSWRTEPGRAVRALAIAAVIDVLGAALLWAMVQQKTTPALQGFWAEYYPPLDKLSALRRFFKRGPGRDFLSAAFEPLRPLALLVPLGVLRLLLTRWTRALGVFALLLTAAVFASAALHLYPLGAPRLDSFARPLQICFAAVALQPWTLRRVPPVLRVLGRGTCVALLVAATLHVQGDRVSYVPAGEKPLAGLVQRWLRRPDTALLLFPWANWAFAYYTDEPVDLVPVDDSTNGFFAIPERAGSLVLRETWQGVFFADYARDKRAFADQIAPLLSTQPRRIAFYGSYGDGRDYRAIFGQLHRHGYKVVQQRGRHRAIAALLERR